MLQMNSILKRIKSKFVFLIPVILFLIGIIAQFFIIPQIYGVFVPIIDFIFYNPKNIMATLRSLNILAAQENSIIEVQIFWWIWLTSFTFSLFIVGKRLQKKPESNIENVFPTKKELYLSVCNITKVIKQLKMNENNKELDFLVYDMKRLEERLFIEDDFGCGGSIIIECENNIARQIQKLNDITSHIESYNLDTSINDANKVIQDINSLLYMRIELKRH